MRDMKPLILLPFLFLLHFSTAQMQPSPDRYEPYAQATFSPSMAIIIVILIAALFFMGFFSIYIRHCSTADSSTTIRPLSASQRNRRRGIPPSVIETFPTLVYSEVKVLKIGKGALECAVCLCEFEDDETLRLIPKCDHVFHPDCIDAWLASHTTCPVCRANLSDGEVRNGNGNGNGNGNENTTTVTVPPVEQGNSESESESESDIEAQVQNDRNSGSGRQNNNDEQINVTVIENRQIVGSSRSNRPRKFPRSHSTGHSLIQPGENTERFTLRLPVDVRKEIMSRELNRANSLVVFRRESSSRRGYRTGGGGEGSSRGKNGGRWLDRLDRSFKSDRWVFRGSFNIRASSSSLKSPKVAAAAGNDESIQSKRPPV